MPKLKAYIRPLNPSVPAIYEAGFIYDGVRIRVDILERLGNGRWNMVEVKSSTSEKDIYLPDVAVQYHVLKGSGLDVDRIMLMHLNNQYVYDGNNLELDQLFSRTDMTKKALVYLNQVPSLISDFNDIGDNVVKLREFLDAKRTGSRARVLVEISHSAQKEVATELWNMFKRLVSLCMGKYTLGLVAASKVLFSVFPEEAQPIDNAEWRNVFKTIDFIAFHLTAYHKGEKAGITFVLNLPVTGMPPEAIINDGLFTQDRYNRPVEHDAAKIERAQKKLFLSIVRELGLTLQRENPQKARLY